MHLTAVVSLMIEDMRQCVDELLLDTGRPADRSIAYRAREVLLAESLDKCDDACVFGNPRRAQRAELVE